MRRGRLPPSTGLRNRVLPDGCLDIIFNLGSAPRREGIATHGLRGYVVGPMRSAAVFDLVERVDYLGVRFRPGGALPFLGISAHELQDRAVDLDQLWPDSEHLIDRLAELATCEKRIEVLERALLLRFRRDRTPHPAVPAASQLIRSSRGRVQIRQLARACGLSDRHLRRLFQEAVGLSPKQAASIARFQHVAGRLRRGERHWARLAWMCGYHDQPHLIHEFRALAGLAPQAYLAERAMSDFYKT